MAGCKPERPSQKLADDRFAQWCVYSSSHGIAYSKVCTGPVCGYWPCAFIGGRKVGNMPSLNPSDEPEALEGNNWKSTIGFPVVPRNSSYPSSVVSFADSGE